MKTTLAFMALVAVCAAGCMNVGSTRYPQPTTNFAPKRLYAIGLPDAYSKVEKTLDNARIAIASQNKSDTSARIQTDYIAGESIVVGGILASQSSRYRYSITLRPDGDKTNIGVSCRVESTSSNGEGSTQWQDTSGQNARLVGQLETWLYEQIEKNL